MPLEKIQLMMSFSKSIHVKNINCRKESSVGGITEKSWIFYADLYKLWITILFACIFFKQIWSGLQRGYQRALSLSEQNLKSSKSNL